MFRSQPAWRKRTPSGRNQPVSRGFGFELRLGLLTGVVGLLVAGGAFLWLSGWPQRQAHRTYDYAVRLSQRAHFAVRDVVVEGRAYTDKAVIFDALGAAAGGAILTFDLPAAHERLKQLPWVADASIERRLPDTIIVRLTEREPLARWQHNNRTVVIDREGKVLTAASLEQFASLPLVVGADAPAETKMLLTALRDFPDVERLVTASVRVGERRWNLYLQTNNIIVRLPEDEIGAALKRLSDLINDQKILDRPIAAIDLRLPNRLTLEPTTSVETKETKK